MKLSTILRCLACLSLLAVVAVPVSLAEEAAKEEATGSKIAGIDLEKATSAIQKASQGLMKLASQNRDRVMQQTSRTIRSKALDLVKSFGAEEGALRQQTVDVVEGLTGKDLGGAIKGASLLYKAGLTEDQKTLAGELRDNASAFALQSLFGKEAELKGDVGGAVTALRAGKTLEALPYLHAIAKKAELNPMQKALAGSLIDTYAPAVRGVQDKARDALNIFGR